MPEIRSAPRLARNAVLATAAVLLTAAVLTLAVVRPGTRPEACPSGEDWVVAQPIGVAMADYQTPATSPTAKRGTGNPAAGAAGTATGSSAAGAATEGAGAVLLAGCVDTDRLHPVPLSTDGRG
jgi:hypothetical protein